MITLYRCSSLNSSSPRESFKFLQSENERASVSSYLRLPSSIDRVFERGPIKGKYESRFGPTGHERNPLYMAIDTDTTFYEYGFHALHNEDNKDGTEFNISCFKINCNLQNGNFADPSNDPNVTQILNGSTDYSAAHKWFKNINPEPEIVRYPSVRHPSANLPEDGLNYAIYDKKFIIEAKSIEQLIMKLDKRNKAIIVYDSQFTEKSTLKPKF